MKKIFLTLSVITSITIVSCGGEQKNETPENTDATIAAEETCFYSYNEAAGAQVSWTAFKTTAKTPVGAKFDEVNVTAGQKSTKITDVLKTIKFNIPTSSTNSALDVRDAKIVASFFGAMDATDIIIGQVKDATGDNKSGVCIFYLTLNNIEKEVTLNYTLEDDLLKLTGEINILDFNGENALASLNKVCEDLHKGEDGVSKTWSVVDLSIETVLNKKCH